MMISKKSHLNIFALSILAVSLSICSQSCIKNDLPYPQITQKILEIAANGESKPAYIDSITFEVNLYLEESTDIQNVRFSKYEISPDGTSNPDLLHGTYDLSSPLFVTLSLYQDYSWEIKANQSIERYFEVAGQIGESVIDVVAKRVVVNMPVGTDLSQLSLQRVKLGAKDVSTMSPSIEPGTIDLIRPLNVDVTAHGRTESWTIYAQFTESVVTTTQVDAWSKVIWAYGDGPADVSNGFEYRKSSDSEWTSVPAKYVSQTQGAFSCYIPHLQPLTEYVVRSVSGDNYGNEMVVTTQGIADIPGGDFEEWHENSSKSNMWCPWSENGERYWDTGNGGSITLGQNLTTPTDHTPTGVGLAARCETRYVNLLGIGKLGAGSIFVGDYVRTDGTNGVLAFGRQWNLRPTILKGYFQYNAATIDYASNEMAHLKGRPDSCHIYVAVTDWTAPYEIRTNPKNRQIFDKNASFVIGYGELVYSGKMDDYEPFEIKLNYKDTSKIPTYLQITCCASKYGDYFTGGAGSLLYVDNFSFSFDYEE